jgi:hypothetical protein
VFTGGGVLLVPLKNIGSGPALDVEVSLLHRNAAGEFAVSAVALGVPEVVGDGPHSSASSAVIAGRGIEDRAEPKRHASTPTPYPPHVPRRLV